ncbi:MAG: hypothetical protein HN509_00195 [Halobacteriovoraceae bacterium]|jgi:hypothetical protein|nr:hypothetical protein [Halobacteriovoraceae bacterium]MBT5095112.1 hypothetical protein [Halobacteriovoraceae bacterium]
MSSADLLPYEIKISKTEQKVPVVEGVHLHSIYNPDREAEGFVAKHLDSIKDNSKVLILGLGFGYHVNHIVQKLKQLYGTAFEVCVIEPNRQVYNDCLSLNNLNLSENISVHCFDHVDSFYRELGIVNFLKEKPVVLMHPASYNLYQNFFREFLTYKAPRDIRHILDSISNPEVKSYLNSYSSALTLDHVLDQLKNETPIIDNPVEFALLAFNEIGSLSTCEESHE